VILSHGHPDHIGGSLNEDGKPAFPNARYVTFREEWIFGCRVQASRNCSQRRSQEDDTGLGAKNFSGVSSATRSRASGHRDRPRHNRHRCVLGTHQARWRSKFRRPNSAFFSLPTPSSILFILNIRKPSVQRPPSQSDGSDQTHAAGKGRERKISCIHLSFRLSWAGACSTEGRSVGVATDSSHARIRELNHWRWAAWRSARFPQPSM